MNQNQCSGLLAAAALACSAFLSPAVAQEIEQQTSNGVSYVTGGVGAEERQAMQELSPQYNLKLMFADKVTGEYRSGLSVEVRDMRGNVRLQADDTGPMLYAQLPPGRYRVTANVDGQQQQRTVTVGRQGSRSTAFYWDAEAPVSMGR